MRSNEREASAVIAHEILLLDFALVLYPHKDRLTNMSVHPL